MGKYTAEVNSVFADIKAAGTTVPMTYVPVIDVADVDPITDTPAVPVLPVTVNVHALILPGPSQPNLSVEAGALVRRNSRTLYIAGKGCPLYEIPHGTTFFFERSTWSCQGDTPLDPDSSGQCILHTVVVTR